MFTVETIRIEHRLLLQGHETRQLSVSQVIVDLLRTMRPSSSLIQGQDLQHLLVTSTDPFSVKYTGYSTDDPIEMMLMLQALFYYGGLHNRTYLKNKGEHCSLWFEFEAATPHYKDQDLKFILLWVMNVLELAVMVWPGRVRPRRLGRGHRDGTN